MQLVYAWVKLKQKVTLSDLTNLLSLTFQVSVKVDKNPPVKTIKGIACLPKHLIVWDRSY